MRIKSWIRGLFAAGVLLAAPSAALAWSNQGHMVTGAIAYDDLARTDPALVAKIERIMASHPDKARFDARLEGLTGEARTRRLFELMARWPDDARGGAYDHPSWHYWLRLIPSASDPVNAPPALMTTAAGEAPEAYRLALATVRDGFAPAADRAVALCWLFHLAGDIQQPLHAGHLISGHFPMSDRGGEGGMIKPSAGGEATNLHEYWDNAVGGDDYDLASVEATRVRLEKTWTRADLRELNGKAGPDEFGAWADESYALARSTAYGDGRFEGAPTVAGAVVLTPAYEASRRELGGRRVALGGYRIADTVRAALR
jgi:hypothetical protein